jgi:hypothetical protein
VLESGVNIDPSRGDLRVGPSRTAVHSPASVADLWVLQVYGASLYAARGDGPDIYATTDGTTWTNPHDSSHANGHRGHCLFQGWLLIGSADSGEVLRFTGAAWLDNWATVASQTAVTALCPWQEDWTTRFLFAGCTQSSGRATVNKLGATGTLVTQWVIDEEEVTAMRVFEGTLYVATMSENGSDAKGALYIFDGSELHRRWELADNAVTSFVEYRGELWAGSRKRGKLWTVTTAGLTERFTMPQVVGIGGSFDYSVAMRSLLVHDDRLYVPIVNANGLGVLVGQPLGPAAGVPSPVAPGPTTPNPVRAPARPLLASADAGAGPLASVPAMGWSTPSVGSLGTQSRGAASFLGQVYITNQLTAGASVIRLDTTAHTSGIAITGSFDAGLPATDKLMVKVRLRHAALASQESVQVEYQLDDTGSWTSLGTSDTDGDKGKDFAGLNVSFKRIRFRLTLSLVTTSSTPAVTALTLEYRVRPALKASWEFDCRLEGTAALPLITLDGTADPKTGAQLADVLWATAAKNTAVTLADLDGESKTVEVVGLEERVAPLAQRGGSATLGRVRLQEV